MKTAMKKLFSLVLVAVLLVGVMPFQAFADEGNAILRVFIGAEYTDKEFPSGTYSADYILQQGYAGNVDAYVLKVGYEGENVAHQAEVHVPASQYILLYVTPASVHNHTPGADATCTTDQTCTSCGDILVRAPGHDWDDATCTVAKTCSVCGATEGEALGHDWEDATYTAPKTCKVCGETEGEPLTPAKATVLIRAKAPSDPGYPDGGEFEVDAGTYSVNEIFGKSNFSSEHNGYCVTGTGIDGQRNQGQNLEIVAGGEYYLWIELKENTPPVVNPTPDDDDEDSDVKTACKVCGGTVKAVDVDGTTVYMCEACSMDEDACTCEDEPENTQGKVKLTLDYNYWGAADTEMYVNRHDSLLKIIGQIPAPTRDGYLFDGWTLDPRGNESIDHRDYVSSRGTTKIYAQWIEQVQVVGKGYDIKVNLNYNHKMGETLKNVAKGTTMGDALEYINTPYRHGYKFLGWYWDPNCKNDVERRDVVLKDCTIYAKWERAASEVMLKIYTNGNTESPAKIVDLYDHSHDKYISLWEVKEIVKGYYTAKDSDGLSFYGLFDFDGWKSFTHNRHHKGVKDIPVNENGDTVVYVMVHNATVYSSSSSGTADSSNPKTGDMIFTSVTVLGASASCLAVLFYLNKKRAI